MNFAEFHNALRILLNIDGDEFVHAVFGPKARVIPHSDSPEWTEWVLYRAAPHIWLIQAPDEYAKALWKVVEARQPKKETTHV